ncbi:MAG: glycosyltransferase family 1 protein [Chloroflexota bacterium]
MILGVNGIRLVGQRSGVARVIEAVLNGLNELEHPFHEIRVYSPRPIDAGVRLPPFATNVVIPSRLPLGLWEQVTLLQAHGSRDILFCPSYTLPLFARCPTLLTHHGSYEGYKDAAQVFSFWMRLKARVMYDLSANRATIVSTVSRYSQKDMAHFYRLNPERIRVIPNGVDTRLFKPLNDPQTLSAWRRKTLGDDRPFILYVGKPTKRRNLPSLLRAFAFLKQKEGIPHRLLLVGSSLPGTSFTGEIRSLGLERDVADLPYLEHDEIVQAYNACEMLVYPSSYEGFGMPVLEAMACGTPVIALNNTAFPEFAGDVAMLLPDAKPETLAEGMLKVIRDPVLRTQMAQAGPKRAASYDWRVVTRMYLDLLMELTERNQQTNWKSNWFVEKL